MVRYRIVHIDLPKARETLPDLLVRESQYFMRLSPRGFAALVLDTPGMRQHKPQSHQRDTGAKAREVKQTAMLRRGNANY